MKLVAVFIGAVTLTLAGASAQTVALPALKPGDKWVYLVKMQDLQRETRLGRYEWTVSRVTSRNLVVAIRPLDSNLPSHEEFLNPDWSKAISLKGQESVIRRAFDFPLTVGKTWTIQWENDNLGPIVKFERNELAYQVVGWEDVKVPAGTFRALKIEADGYWYREFNEQGPGVSSSISSNAAGSATTGVVRKPFTPPPARGRRYQAWWYVPDIKREVRLVIEDAGAAADLGHRETAELESFTPAR